MVPAGGGWRRAVHVGAYCMVLLYAEVPWTPLLVDLSIP
jgi:hypothetical protein